MLLLEKSFTLISFVIELDSFILAICASFHKNIFKNTVKLATSRGKNGLINADEYFCVLGICVCVASILLL